MKYLDEYENRSDIERLAKKIRGLKVKANLMEVCGTHTMAMFRFGLRDLLPKGVAMISGPGCPVCVTSQEDIDRMIAISRKKNVIIATFGDMMKVPGTGSSLNNEKAKGADIRVVYSPLECLDIAKAELKKMVVFIGVGFETTVPTVAKTIKIAEAKKISNFRVFISHKTIPAAMEAILSLGEVAIDGFMCPGHVSAVIGSKAYEDVAANFKIPCVIAGFEPVDILEAIYMLLRQKKNGEAKVENAYKRAVKYEGNIVARNIIDEVFEPSDAIWRGIGTIPKSGLKLRKEYLKFDAAKCFDVKIKKPVINKGCICGKVLRGIARPVECRMFSKVCTPENPLGPCMVSSEGACAAYYKYRRR